jgi:hypothetical protein
MKKPKKITYFPNISLLLAFFLLACVREEQSPSSGHEPGLLESALVAPDSSDLNVSTPKQFSFHVTNDLQSRWQEITLTITDQSGNPVPNLEVECDQVDIDFYFDSSNCPQCAWTEIENDEYLWNIKQKPNASKLIHDYLDFGFNAEIGYFGIWWNQAEPENNEWNSFFCQFSDGEYPCIGAVQGEIWQEQPRPNRFFYSDLGPDFRFNHDRDRWRPEWLDITDESIFKSEFEEYMAEVIRRGDKTVDGYNFYMIGYESAGGSDILPWSSAEVHSDKMVQEWVDFFDWQIKTIHKYDKDAVIGLNLHSIGWDREHMDLPDNMAPQPFIEGLIAKNADFDIIGFEIHPGASSCEGDDREFNKRFLDTFKQYGKKIYFWEYAVSSRGSLPVENWCKDWAYSIDSMDEEYQERVFMEIFDLFFQDPQVIGIRILDYIDKPIEMRDPEDLWWREVDLGLLNQDGIKKPVYDSLKEYWHNMFTSYSGSTDENGQISFNAIPGLFEVSLAGYKVSVHLYPEDSIFVKRTGDMIVSLNGTGSSASTSPPLAPPIESEAPMAEDSLSPCDLTKDMIGQDVTVFGRIGFVDQSSAGTFFELEDQGCRVGAMVMQSDLEGWPQDIQGGLEMGTSVQAMGKVGEFQGMLELQVFVLQLLE